MGTCLGKTADEDLSNYSTGAVVHRDSVCSGGTAGFREKQKRGTNSLEEVVNQLIRETLSVIGSVVEK